MKGFALSRIFFQMSHLAPQIGRFAVESHILAPISTKMMVIWHQSGWKDHVKSMYSGSVNCFTP